MNVNIWNKVRDFFSYVYCNNVISTFLQSILCPQNCNRSFHWYKSSPIINFIKSDSKGLFLGRHNLKVTNSTFNIARANSHSARCGPWWPFFPGAANSGACAVSCFMFRFWRLRAWLWQTITTLFLSSHLCFSSGNNSLEKYKFCEIDDNYTMKILRRKIFRAPSRNRTHDLPVTSLDALTTEIWVTHMVH